MNVYQLIENICTGYTPKIDEIELLLNADTEFTPYIFQSAENITLRYCLNEIHVRGIIEFSNYCRCDCTYCGLNRHNKRLRRYRMGHSEIIDTAKEAVSAGYRTIVLQSGEDLRYTREKISRIIRDIKSLGDVAVTLSLGERDYEDYKQWKKDGADRFLLKHETLNRSLYNSLHPHSDIANRLRCLSWLKDLGYQTGSGLIIGLPGQKPRDIAKDILFLNRLNGAMAGIGPFIPHKDTELRDAAVGSNILTLKALAVARLVLKDVHLPATTALRTLDDDGAKKAFRAGANVIMLKLEPYKYRKLYEIYPKNFGDECNIKQERAKIEVFIKSMGKEVAKDRGDSLKDGERL